MTQPFDFQSRTRVVFGPESLGRLSELAAEIGFRRTLLVADEGLIKAGHVDRAMSVLDGVDVTTFSDFDANPDSDMVERGRLIAARAQVDSIIGLGGGSSMDCAKGINFVLTNGGTMQDYWGHGKADQPMLPSIGIPTTAGTGSEAQSYCIISDAVTHVKMACGDEKAVFQVALLDPELLISQPADIRATAGYDAISHAVESFVTTKRNAMSQCFSREAWRLLSTNFERVLAFPDDIEALGAMQTGAYLAGLAIENSMLGAAHACANPLTAAYGTSHGVAIGVMLPHVVRWNAQPEYQELRTDLDRRLDDLACAAGLPRTLSEIGIPRTDLPNLAENAAKQWTGKFNPRPFDAAAALELYTCAY